MPQESPAPLSEKEKRKLDQIEQSLYADHPGLSKGTRRNRKRLNHGRKLWRVKARDLQAKGARQKFRPALVALVLILVVTMIAEVAAEIAGDAASSVHLKLVVAILGAVVGLASALCWVTWLFIPQLSALANRIKHPPRKGKR